ncbi:BZ3500_MvSof-1268-A1-R1_C035g00010 [Microbotryum saponariae]|uniref:BZ3500_MvSof-1268-A1-R1_C035g00010 protein n=1 Tax=Microbotryum saponariae TaxID=289078 RepID=A0A2X0NB79_9BASI|nr:BZ3500_MvSof-1268-A1-R1_C035g00010 [Microbotryum saponariae]
MLATNKPVADVDSGRKLGRLPSSIDGSAGCAPDTSNVIRVIMDGPVQTALRKHFGLAETPFMFARPEGVVLDPEVEKLFSKCVKLNPIVTKATKRFPIARHMYELVFESEQACLEAASAGPFPYHGKEMVTELPSASPLNHVVQV